jgi:hypothetical protein
MKLKAYQVGEYDVVAAYDENQAIHVFKDYAGDEEDDYDVKEITGFRLTGQVRDEDGNYAESIQEMLDALECSKGGTQYLFGWE